jgi:hypothetical protein
MQPIRFTAKEKKVLMRFFKNEISLLETQRTLGYKHYTTVYIRTIHLLRSTPQV